MSLPATADPARLTPPVPGNPTAVDALNHLNDIVSRYCQSQMLLTACQLGFFDHLCDDPVSAADLARRLNVHPDACARLLTGLAQLGLARRENGGFRSSPVGADVITLGWVLHDWGDDNCLRILRHCYDALPPGGALLIVESVLNHDLSGTDFGVLMSLHMLVLCEPGARERSQAEYQRLLEQAGFHFESFMRLPAPRDLLIARK